MSNFVRLLALSVAFVGVGVQPCSESSSDHPNFVPPGAAGEPDGLVVTPPALPPPVNPAAASATPLAPIAGTRVGDTITLPSGAQVFTTVIDGHRYVPIEATFSERSWQAIVGK